MKAWLLLPFILAVDVLAQSPAAPSFGFTPSAPLGVRFPNAVAVGDFNGDGAPDIVTVGTAINVILGDGKGNFGKPITSFFKGEAETVTVADLNGDGRADLITYNGSTTPNIPDTLDIFFGNGDGTFTQGPSYSVSAGVSLQSVLAASPLAIADFDGDGRPDIAIINNSAKTVDIMLNNGNGSFQPPMSYGSGYDVTWFLAAGDFNNDGRLDLLLAGKDFPTTMTLMTGIAGGGFGPPVKFSASLPGGAAIVGLAVADFNGDGKLDFVTCNSLGGDGVSGQFTSVSVYLGRGDGKFVTPAVYRAVGSYPDLSAALYGFAVTIVPPDVTGDGKPDIAVAFQGGSGGAVEVFPGNGDGTFQSPAVYNVGVRPAAMAFGDLNGDGRTDLVFASRQDQLSVLIGTQAPSLRVNVTHTGDFTIGAGFGTFTISVSNAPGASTTVGTITVLAISGLYDDFLSLLGTGWECIPTGVPECSRSDPLGPGASYPPIMVKVQTGLSYPVSLPATERAVVTGGGSALTGANDSATVLPYSPPVIAAVVNAASFGGGPVAPGEIVSIFGSNLGPVGGLGLALDPEGNVANVLAGVSVSFNGYPAPLTYVSATQINCVVPYEVNQQGFTSTSVRVSYGALSNVYLSNLVAVAPGIFTLNGSGTGPGAIGNDAGGYNGPGNPASQGSTIVLYMTGEGQTSPSGVTGKVTTVNTSSSGPLTPRPLLQPNVTIGGQPATVTFYGEAPGLVSGVMQINAQIPIGLPGGNLPLAVALGGTSSPNGVTVSVQ